MTIKALCIIALVAFQRAAPLPALPVVSLESLATDYREYDGKDVVIAGIVIVGPESTFMAMPTATPPSEQDLMWVEVSSAVAKSPGALDAEYMRRQKSDGLITAILLGRFHGRDRRSFGHLICCRFQFEIAKVLSIG